MALPYGSVYYIPNTEVDTGYGIRIAVNDDLYNVEGYLLEPTEFDTYEEAVERINLVLQPYGLRHAAWAYGKPDLTTGTFTTSQNVITSMPASYVNLYSELMSYCGDIWYRPKITTVESTLLGSFYPTPGVLDNGNSVYGCFSFSNNHSSLVYTYLSESFTYRIGFSNSSNNISSSTTAIYKERVTNRVVLKAIPFWTIPVVTKDMTNIHISTIENANPKNVICNVDINPNTLKVRAYVSVQTGFNQPIGNRLNGCRMAYALDPMGFGGYSVSNDPAAPGGPGLPNPAGGDGTFTLQSDDVPESPLPSASSSIIGAGCGTAYCDTGLNVRSLMSYMWTHADDIIANLKKIIANPIDAILGLHIVPVMPTVGGAQEVYLGNVGSGVSMTPITTPYLRYRLGSLVINKYWGSALDFNPFTQFSIHLPYIGFRQLNTDDLMGSTCELYYDIDVISGACVAHLKVTRTDPLTRETHTVDQYSWPGNCAMQIPVTSTNYQGLYSAIFNSVVAVASGIAGAAVGGLIGAGGEVAGKTLATSITHTASNTANNLFNGGSKIRVEKSGNLSGVHGFLGSQYAFIERVTPRQSLASVYREVLGYPSNTTQVLGTCTGFTQIEEINLENFSCTADEKDELERLLKGGVIF